jgi:hypothetical protein
MNADRSGLVTFDEVVQWVTSVECPGVNARTKKLPPSPGKVGLFVRGSPSAATVTYNSLLP